MPFRDIQTQEGNRQSVSQTRGLGLDVDALAVFRDGMKMCVSFMVISHTFILRETMTESELLFPCQISWLPALRTSNGIPCFPRCTLLVYNRDQWDKHSCHVVVREPHPAVPTESADSITPPFPGWSTG